MGNMTQKHIQEFDLNLLLTLDALLSTQSVTKAADRLGTTQPGVSRALARLRHELGDPLLVRGRGSMVLTERASSLREPVRHILEAIERTVLAGPGFDPARAERRFVLATTDYCEALLMPSLLARIRASAPGIDLQVRAVPSDLQPSLEDGDVDLAISNAATLPPSLKQRRLFGDRMACLVRRDHPQVGRRLDLDTFCELPHLLVMIDPGGRPTGIVDEVLGTLQRRRRIAMTVSNFLIAQHLVAATDLIVTNPRRLVSSATKMLPVRMLEPPLDLPAFTLSACWHARRDDDLAHRWLREQLVRAAEELPKS